MERSRSEVAMLAELQRIERESEVKALKWEIHELKRQHLEKLKEAERRVGKEIFDLKEKFREEGKKWGEEKNLLILEQDESVGKERSKLREAQDKLHEQMQMQQRVVSELQAKLFALQSELDRGHHRRNERRYEALKENAFSFESGQTNIGLFGQGGGEQASFSPFDSDTNFSVGSPSFFKGGSGVSSRSRVRKSALEKMPDFDNQLVEDGANLDYMSAAAAASVPSRATPRGKGERGKPDNDNTPLRANRGGAGDEDEDDFDEEDDDDNIGLRNNSTTASKKLVMARKEENDVVREQVQGAEQKLELLG
jgi:hypothetical protein